MVRNLSQTENERVVAIIDASKSGDWDRFSFLADKPFKNTATMKEQFDESSRLIRNKSDDIELDMDLNVLDDGSRLIFVKLRIKSEENPILLTLQSTSDASNTKISVLTFYQEISFG